MYADLDLHLLVRSTISNINPLPDDKILALSKLKAIADDKVNVIQMLHFIFYDRVENIVGQGENTGCQHFLLFPQCFQKASFLGSLKVHTL